MGIPLVQGKGHTKFRREKTMSNPPLAHPLLAHPSGLRVGAWPVSDRVARTLPKGSSTSVSFWVAKPGMPRSAKRFVCSITISWCVLHAGGKPSEHSRAQPGGQKKPPIRLETGESKLPLLKRPLNATLSHSVTAVGCCNHPTSSLQSLGACQSHIPFCLSPVLYH